MKTGSCMCGAVRFEVTGPLPPADACHCTECRKWSGHIGVGSDVRRDALTIDGEQHVTWYHSSAHVRRGFCATCGSSLFFDPLDQTKHDWIGVCLGAFDEPTETHVEIHVFVSEKADYYEILDDAPQAQTVPGREGT